MSHIWFDTLQRNIMIPFTSRKVYVYTWHENKANYRCCVNGVLRSDVNGITTDLM